MVIAGVTDYSPMRAGAASVVFEKPTSASGAGTMATGSPPPSAPKPATVDAEKTPPLVSAGPHGGNEAAPSAPAVAPPAPTVAPVPPAPVVASTTAAPAGEAAVPPVPVPGAPGAPVVSVPGELAPASASSPKAASATTVGPAPMVAPPGANLMAPALPPAVPVGARDVAAPAHLPPALPAAGPVARSPGWQWGLEGSPRAWWRREVSSARDNGGQREVSRAVREERAAQSQSSSLRAAPAHVAPRPTVPPVVPPPAAALPPPVLAPSAPSPSVAAPAPGSRLHLPPVPPVAGVEFVAAGGGAAAAQYAADEPLQFLAEALQPPQTRVPESTLGQLHRLAESLHALLLIQVLAHSSLPVIPPETFRDRPRETCLDAADQLAVLLAPVLAAPAEGGAAAAG
ncbi:unnamed protein product [Closterium sp. Naga37s-1]|nr:unnamed protein product [Closterium sp. Naga37s-1]